MYKKKKKTAPPHPQQELIQSMKSINVERPSSIDSLVSDQSEKTKEVFSFCTPSLKAILFLVFQTDQNKHRGPAFHTVLRFLPTQASS